MTRNREKYLASVIMVVVQEKKKKCGGGGGGGISDGDGITIEMWRL